MQQFKGRNTNTKVERIIEQKQKDLLILKGKVDSIKSEIKLKNKEFIEVKTRVSTRQNTKDDLETNWNQYK